jgi:hypothetical protein
MEYIYSAALRVQKSLLVKDLDKADALVSEEMLEKTTDTKLWSFYNMVNNIRAETSYLERLSTYVEIRGYTKAAMVDVKEKRSELKKVMRYVSLYLKQ